MARDAGLDEWNILSTREDGAKFHSRLLQELVALPPEGLLRLDFSEVRLMDASFADAALVVLALDLARGEFPERYLILENLSNASLQNLSIAVKGRHGRDENKHVRNLVLPVLTEEKQIEPYGKLESHLLNPWELVRQGKALTARDLATALSLDIGAASTKLKTLHDLRLLRREEIRDEFGKQFRYRPFL